MDFEPRRFKINSKKTYHKIRKKNNVYKNLNNSINRIKVIKTKKNQLNPTSNYNKVLEHAKDVWLVNGVNGNLQS